MGRFAVAVRRILFLAIACLVSSNIRFLVRWFKFNSITPRNPPLPEPPESLPFLPNLLVIGRRSLDPTNTTKSQVCAGDMLQQYQLDLDYLDTPEQWTLAYRDQYLHCVLAEATWILDVHPQLDEYLPRAKLVHDAYGKDSSGRLEQLKIVFFLQEPAFEEDQLLHQYHHYAYHLSQWFQYFDPLQILIVNNQEPNETVQQQLLQFLHQDDDEEEVTKAGRTYSDESILGFFTTTDNDSPTSAIDCSNANHLQLQKLVESWNEELYELLATLERPPAEAKPFPPFPRPPCR